MRPQAVAAGSNPWENGKIGRTVPFRNQNEDEFAFYSGRRRDMARLIRCFKGWLAAPVEWAAAG